MSKVTETAYATQRNPKACETCRQSKSRCYPSHEIDICQRCVKYKFSCVVRAAARPRRSKKTGGVVLQHSSRNAQATVEDDEGTDVYIKLPASFAVDNSDAVSILSVQHREAFSHIFSPDGKGSIEDHCVDLHLAVMNGAEQVTKTVEKVQRNLSIDEAEKLLAAFRSMANLFPFVVLPENATVQSMSRTSPFLLLAILALASFDDAQLHHGLDYEFKRILGSEIIAMGKKSLDFLQGVLVYTCWYPCHINPRNRQSFMFINVATSLAIELGLDKSRPGVTLLLTDSVDSAGLIEGSEFTKAAKRAYMGCYYLSAAISLGFQKPNGMQYNDLLEEYGIYLATEPEVITDFALLPLIKQYKLEERIRVFLKMDQMGFTTSQLQSDAQLQLFRGELDELRSHTVNDVRSMTNFALTDRFTEISLYSYDLGLFRRENSKERYLNSRNLLACLDACRRFFEYLLALPINKYMTFTHVQWGCMVQAIVILSRLSFPISNCPGWDSQAARERVPLVMYLDCLCYRMQALTSVPAGQTELPTNPDAPYTFKAVLEFIVRKFNERLEQIDTAKLTGETQSDRLCRCPMSDPELSPLFIDDAYPQSTKSGTGASPPLYFDLWNTMTVNWGEADYGA